MKNDKEIKTAIKMDRKIWEKMKAQAILSGMKIPEYLEKIIKENLSKEKKKI